MITLLDKQVKEIQEQDKIMERIEEFYSELHDSDQAVTIQVKEYALRYVKQHENIMRKDSLAKKLAMSDPTKFWSEIRTMSGQNNTLPSCVEGVSGMGRIAEQWRLHFEHLFNCVQDPERYNMSFNNSEYNDDMVVTTEEVVSAIQKLDTGKSSGLDGIFAEHYIVVSGY